MSRGGGEVFSSGNRRWWIFAGFRYGELLLRAGVCQLVSGAGYAPFGVLQQLAHKLACRRFSATHPTLRQEADKLAHPNGAVACRLLLWWKASLVAPHGCAKYDNSTEKVASFENFGRYRLNHLGCRGDLGIRGAANDLAPPAEFNASTQNAEEAPLTVVTEEIDVDPDEAIEYTVSGEGEFTLMYGQLRDIEAWVGDAAHNRIDGVTTDAERGEDPSLDMTYVDGEAEAPNPADSDLWLATQEVTDEVTQRWLSMMPASGACWIAADGTEPAPADFSVSWVNVEPDSPLLCR